MEAGPSPPLKWQIDVDLAYTQLADGSQRTEVSGANGPKRVEDQQQAALDRYLLPAPMKTPKASLIGKAN